MPALSINRNIVECKGPVTAAVTGSIFVLIETLWNVKDDQRQDALYCSWY